MLKASLKVPRTLPTKVPKKVLLKALLQGLVTVQLSLLVQMHSWKLLLAGRLSTLLRQAVIVMASSTLSLGPVLALAQVLSVQQQQPDCAVLPEVK